MSEGTEYKVGITVEADQAKKEIESVNTGLDEMKDTAASASGEVSSTGGAAQSLGAGASAAATNVDRLGSELEGTANSARTAKAAFDGTASSARGMGSAATTADEDIVRSTRGALKPVADLQATIGRVTTTLVMLKGAWDIGWEAGSFIRGLTEPNTQLKEIKLNAEDVQHVLEYNNKLIAKARASDVAKTIEQGKAGLASADSLRDISGVQSSSMSKLSDYQTLRGMLTSQRDQLYQQFVNSSASGDTEGRKSAEGMLAERDKQIADVDAQIMSLESLISQAASQMQQAISSGVSATGAWDKMDVKDFMSGGSGGVPQDATSVPTVGPEGRGIMDYQRGNDQRTAPTTPAAPSMAPSTPSQSAAPAASKQTTDLQGPTAALKQSAGDAADAQKSTADNISSAADLMTQNTAAMLAASKNLAAQQAQIRAEIAATNNYIAALASRATRSANAS